MNQHNVDIVQDKVKISFNKENCRWKLDKENLRLGCDMMYIERGATMYIPLNIHSVLNVWAYTAARKAVYYLTDEFREAVPEIIENEKRAVGKLKLLQERVTLDTIESRPTLLQHKDPQPFKHQRVGLEYAVRFPGFYTLDEPGLGKTRIGIERHWFLKDTLGKVDKSLVICPVSLLYSWHDEIIEWSDFTSVIIRGTKKQKIKLLSQKADFHIINYEGVNAVLPELLDFVTARTNIILDEYIKIKNNKARQTKQAVKICNNTNYVHALCGTPITQGPGDVFAPSLAVDKGRSFGYSEKRFHERYFFKIEFKQIPKRGTPEFVSKTIYKNGIRFLKSECTDLPEKTFQTIELDIGKNKKHYSEMADYAMTIVQDKTITAPIILVQVLKLSQITSGFIKVKDEDKIVDFDYQPKLTAVQELLESNPGHQFVIWSRFTHDVARIAELCIKLHLTYGCLVGQNKEFDVPKPGKERATMLREFKKENLQIMIGTAMTGGLGINELARADRVIYYSNDYSYLHRDQSQERTHRTGSVNNCIYYDLVIKDTVDVSVLKILKGKKNMADIITKDNLISLIGGKV